MENRLQPQNWEAYQEIMLKCIVSETFCENIYWTALC